MGYPSGDTPLDVVWKPDLWKSPCGLHDDYVDGNQVLFTYQFSPYDPTWRAYFRDLGQGAALIRDGQCDDFDHLLRNPYVEHLGIAVRCDGSLWHRRALGDLLSLRFWGLTTKKEGQPYD